MNTLRLMVMSLAIGMLLLFLFVPFMLFMLFVIGRLFARFGITVITNDGPLGNDEKKS